jgi:hypothetical protein
MKKSIYGRNVLLTEVTLSVSSTDFQIYHQMTVAAAITEALSLELASLRASSMVAALLTDTAPEATEASATIASRASGGDSEVDAAVAKVVTQLLGLHCRPLLTQLPVNSEVLENFMNALIEREDLTSAVR